MKLNAILDAARAVGMAHNGGQGGEFILVARESQLIAFAQKLGDLSRPEVTHDPIRTDAARDATPATGMCVTEDTEAAFQRGKRAGYSEGFRASRDGAKTARPPKADHLTREEVLSIARMHLTIEDMEAVTEFAAALLAAVGVKECPECGPVTKCHGVGPGTPCPVGEQMSDVEYAQRLAHLGKLTPEGLLCELLALIHGDGGHYSEQHGLAKAVADAEVRWHALGVAVSHDREYTMADLRRDAPEMAADLDGVQEAPAPGEPYTSSEKARAWDILCERVRGYEVESARLHRLDEMAKALAATRKDGVPIPLNDQPKEN